MNTAIATINPATGETLETFEPLSSAALEQKVARAHAAFRMRRGLETFDAIAFGVDADRPLPEPEDELDLVGTLERDVFGAPTSVYNGELFWGQDRLDLLNWRLGR